MHSAIYEGRVRHCRSHPAAHAFSYRVFMLWLDLAELDVVFARRWLWSIGRRNLAAFHRADYHGDAHVPLDQAVRDTVQAALGQRPDGPIRLLAHLRYFGMCFNPVSFYFGYDAAGKNLRWVMAEITNTPWRERVVGCRCLCIRRDPVLGIRQALPRFAVRGDGTSLSLADLRSR